MRRIIDFTSFKRYFTANSSNASIHLSKTKLAKIQLGYGIPPSKTWSSEKPARKNPWLHGVAGF